MSPGRVEPLSARIGAVSLLLAIIVLVNSYALHPERGDSPDNPAVFRQVVFREYAQSKGT